MQDFDSHLESHFLPHVKSLYATTVKVHTNIEDVLKLMVQAMKKNERTENDVSCTELYAKCSFVYAFFISCYIC